MEAVDVAVEVEGSHDDIVGVLAKFRIRHGIRRVDAQPTSLLFVSCTCNLEDSQTAGRIEKGRYYRVLSSKP